MLRFRLFGIPFEIAPIFWLGTALLGARLAHGAHGFTLLATWIGCVLVSIIVHELGHALVARCFGVSPQVLLHGLGGLTRMPGSELNRWQGFLVTLGGPAAGFAFYGVAFAVWYYVVLPEVLAIVDGVYFLVRINLYWTLFNLLPVMPLDGGQLMRHLFGPARLVWSRAIGGVIAALVCYYSFTVGHFYSGMLMAVLAGANFRGSVDAL